MSGLWSYMEEVREVNSNNNGYDFEIILSDLDETDPTNEYSRPYLEPDEMIDCEMAFDEDAILDRVSLEQDNTRARMIVRTGQLLEDRIEILENCWQTYLKKVVVKPALPILIDAWHIFVRQDPIINEHAETLRQLTKFQ